MVAGQRGEREEREREREREEREQRRATQRGERREVVYYNSAPEGLSSCGGDQLCGEGAAKDVARYGKGRDFVFSVFCGGGGVCGCECVVCVGG